MRDADYLLGRPRPGPGQPRPDGQTEPLPAEYEGAADLCRSGIGQGQSEALVYLLDIFPTVCDFIRADTPAGLDGRSLKGIMDGKQRNVRETLFTTYRDVQRAVRDERWKLIRYPQINRTQLFDLQSGPEELNDLSADAAHAGRLQQLLAALAGWQKGLGDTLPLTSDNPKPAAFTPPQP